MAPMCNTLLALATLAMASTAWCAPRGPPGYSTPTYTLPLDEVSNTGASPLPTPSTNPKYILLGLGFQNYTCGPANTYIQTVPSAGAIADLYDITRKVTKKTADSYTSGSLKSFEKCLKDHGCQPSPANNYCQHCHKVAVEKASVEQRRTGEPSCRVGLHYFDQVNGVQSPNFNIFKYGDFFSGKKAAGVKAPASANDGANGLGAVDWIYLVDNGSGRTHGITSIYRVETAGGVAPSTCSAQGSALSVSYAAEYWFYN